jgi:mRNA-degrading endonuclease HigB of HigAB toxin-antitoxin module
MKKLLNKEAFNKLKYQLTTSTKSAYYAIKTRYQKLSKRQRIILFSGVGLVVVLAVALNVDHHSKKITPGSAYPVNFETQSHATEQSSVQTVRPSVQTRQLQSQLDQVKQNSSEQYDAMRTQLQSIQSNMSSFASKQGMQQLQQVVSKPNKTLLGKMNNLQSSVKQIVKQTAKKTWVSPQSIEKYFRLVAVQGFSDGMRAIIDVDGNQTTLSQQAVCPACRGWILQSMNFANQSAVFAKQAKTQKNQQLFVKLQAN